MYKVFCSSFVLVSLLCFASFAAQPSGGKGKIAAAPQGQMNMMSSSQLQNHVMPSIKNNLFHFIEQAVTGLPIFDPLFKEFILSKNPD